MVKLIIKNINYILGFYMGFSMLFLLLIESTNTNDLFLDGFKFLFIPIGILLFSFFIINFKQVYRAFGATSKSTFWIYCFGIYILLLLMTGPYLLAVNAALSNYEVHKISGLVIDKSKSRSGGKYTSTEHILVIKDETTSKSHRLQTTENQYKKINKGDYYSECFYIGRLNTLFKWRFISLKNC